MKKVTLVILSLILAASSITGAVSAQQGNNADITAVSVVSSDISYKVSTAMNEAAEYVYKTVTNPQVGSIGGEWAIIGLSRSGFNVPEEYYNTYYNNAADYVKKCNGVLSEKKYSEYSRVILGLTAIGKNPMNICGYDLVKPLSEKENVSYQGVNGLIYALIALNSGNYIIESEGETSSLKQYYKDEILKTQLTDGGWSFSGQGLSEIDITAMALQALAEYTDEDDVLTAVNKGLEYLSENQLSSGGYAVSGEECSESAAQVITALTALRIAPNSDAFVKNGRSVIDALLEYKQSDGSFRHTMSGSGENQMATEQALYALAAADRYYKGKNTLYDMSDVIEKEENKTENNEGLPQKNEAVKKQPVIYEGKTFNDTMHHSDKDKIEALASRGIINGKSNTEFDPDSTMTRAEFAAIAVKALGLTPVSEKSFDDVSEKDWFYGFAATAKNYGIISGVSEKEFNPSGTITKEEAACMAARAAKLCGIDTDMSEAEIRDTLSEFTDYTVSSEWARSSLAVCFKEGILSDEDIEISPKKNVVRCEIALMFYNMLERAKLI